MYTHCVFNLCELSQTGSLQSTRTHLRIFHLLLSAVLSLPVPVFHALRRNAMCHKDTDIWCFPRLSIPASCMRYDVDKISLAFEKPCYFFTFFFTPDIYSAEQSLVIITNMLSNATYIFSFNNATFYSHGVSHFSLL